LQIGERAGKIAEHFRGYGETVLRTTLPTEKAEKLGKLLAATSP
jgi:hypothetical protein